MLKSELIERLQSIDGNPVVLLCGEGSDFLVLKGVKLKKMHRSNREPGEYIEDDDFEGEVGYNTFYHDNYNIESEECILLTLYE